MPPLFPPVSKADWLAKVEQDLKGKDPADLNFDLAGQTLSPFWHREDLPHPPPPLRSAGGWTIGAMITEQDPGRANQLALAALMGGAESLWFQRKQVVTDDTRERLLKGVLTDIVEVVIDVDGAEATRGTPALDLYHASRNPDRTARLFVPHHPDFFVSLATARALRRCWQRVASVYQRDLPLNLTAVVPAPSDNVHTNKIAQTVSALALVAGGVDTLYIQPSDPEDGTAFSARIARNVQHLLREEARMSTVGDPAAGAYFLENLTSQIAESTWKAFRHYHVAQASPKNRP